MRDVHWKRYTGEGNLLSIIERDYSALLHRLSFSAKAADMDYKRSAGPHKIFSVKLDRKGRLLLTVIHIDDEPVILFLELLAQHEYEKSKYLDHPDRINALLAGESFNRLKQHARPFNASEQVMSDEEAVDEDIEFAPLDQIGGKIIELSEAQFDLLQAQSWPLEINGLAGSGKTYMLARLIQQTIEACADDQTLLYVTKSSGLVREFRELLRNTVTPLQLDRVEIMSYKALVARALGKSVDDAVGYRACNQWLLDKKASLKAVSLSFKQIYSEFCFLASMGNKSLGKCWKTYEKLGRQNRFHNKDELNAILTLYKSYCAYLKESNKFDPALCKEVPGGDYAYVFVDEYQSFQCTELSVIRSMSDNPTQFCLAGDGNQAEQSMQSTVVYRKEYFPHTTKAILNKNFRSAQSVANFANDLLFATNVFLGGVASRDDLCRYDVNEYAHHGEVVLFQEGSAEEAVERCQTTVAPYANSPKFCVIIFNEVDRIAAEHQFEGALVLTADEAHGLEFDDGVLLYNPLGHVDNAGINHGFDWSQVDQATSLVNENRPKDKENFFLKEPAVLFLHQLFLAATRTRHRLWILDLEVSKSPKKFEHYFRQSICASRSVPVTDSRDQVQTSAQVNADTDGDDAGVAAPIGQSLVDWLVLIRSLLEEGQVDETRIFKLIQQHCPGMQCDVFGQLKGQERLAYVDLCKSLVDEKSQEIMPIPQALKIFNKDFFREFFKYNEHVELQIICMLYLDFSDNNSDRLIGRLMKSNKSFGKFFGGLSEDIVYARTLLSKLYNHLIQVGSVSLADAFVKHGIEYLKKKSCSDNDKKLVSVLVETSLYQVLVSERCIEEFIDNFEAGYWDESLLMIQGNDTLGLFFSRLLRLLNKAENEALLIRFFIAYLERNLQIDIVDQFFGNIAAVLPVLSTPNIKEQCIEIVCRQVKHKQLAHHTLVTQYLKHCVGKSYVLDMKAELFSNLVRYDQGVMILRDLLLEWAPTLNKKEQVEIFNHNDFWSVIAGGVSGFIWRVKFYYRLRDFTCLEADERLSSTPDFIALVGTEGFARFVHSLKEKSTSTTTAFMSLFVNSPIFFEVVPIIYLFDRSRGSAAHINYIISALSDNDTALANFILYLGDKEKELMMLMEDPAMLKIMLQALSILPSQAWCMPFNEQGDKFVQLLLRSQYLDAMLDRDVSLPFLRKIPSEAWFVEENYPHKTSISVSLVERITLSQNGIMLFVENCLSERVLRHQVFLEKMTGFQKTPVVIKLLSYFLQKIDDYKERVQIKFFERLKPYLDDYFDTCYFGFGDIGRTPLAWLLVANSGLLFVLKHFYIFKAYFECHVMEHSDVWSMYDTAVFSLGGEHGVENKNGYVGVFRSFLTCLVSIFPELSDEDKEKLEIILKTVPTEVWGCPILDANGELIERDVGCLCLVDRLKTVNPDLYALLERYFNFNDEQIEKMKHAGSRVVENIKRTVDYYKPIQLNYLRKLMKMEFISNEAYDPVFVDCLSRFSRKILKPYTQLLVDHYARSRGEPFNYQQLRSDTRTMTSEELIYSLFSLNDSVDVIILKLFYFPICYGDRCFVNLLMFCDVDQHRKNILSSIMLGAAVDERKRGVFNGFISHVIQLAGFFDTYELLDHLLFFLRGKDDLFKLFIDVLIKDKALFVLFASISISNLTVFQKNCLSKAETVMPYIFYDLCVVEGGINYMLDNVSAIEATFGQVTDLWVTEFKTETEDRFCFLEMLMRFSHSLDVQRNDTESARSRIQKQISAFISLLDLVPGNVWCKRASVIVEHRQCIITPVFVLIRCSRTLLRVGGDALLQKMPRSAWTENNIQIDVDDPAGHSASSLVLLKGMVTENDPVYQMLDRFYRLGEQPVVASSGPALFMPAVCDGDAQGAQPPVLN